MSRGVVFAVIVVFVALVTAACGRSAAPPSSDSREVVRTAHLAAEVERLDGVEASVVRVAEEMGGFVTGSLMMDDSLTLTVRVPQAALAATLDRLSALATRVEARRLEAQDVTAERADLESQRRNFAAARDRLLGLLERAATATEALEVHRALTEVQGQLEQAEGRLAVVKQNVALSTITATFSPRATTGFASWRPLEVARSAAVGLGVVLQALANAAIVALVFAPLWGPVLLVLRHRRRFAAPT
ncbi:MAG: DUF4349 domain-containing protein [Myxococcaceae bacterium]|nr:DUF4349 domain-containing protein [Myxococcaceae bacterium]